MDGFRLKFRGRSFLRIKITTVCLFIFFQKSKEGGLVYIDIRIMVAQGKLWNRKWTLRSILFTINRPMYNMMHTDCKQTNFSLNKWCNNLLVTLSHALQYWLMSSSYSTVSGYHCTRFNLLWLPKSRQGSSNELVFTFLGTFPTWSRLGVWKSNVQWNSWLGSSNQKIDIYKMI